MRYHFFLHYGWFFQNLGKEAVRTFMHTTVCLLFLSNVPGDTFIQGATFIPESRVGWYVLKAKGYYRNAIESNELL